jgi:hypothetical protein
MNNVAGACEYSNEAPPYYLVFLKFWKGFIRSLGNIDRQACNKSAAVLYRLLTCIFVAY